MEQAKLDDFLKEIERVGEKAGPIKLDIIVEPNPLRIPPYKAVTLRAQLENLTDSPFPLKLYIAWRHPTGLIARTTERDIVVGAHEVTHVVDKHTPKASGIRKVMAAVFRNQEIVAAKERTFEVIKELFPRL